MTDVRIALDAMGGDHAPEEIVKGAVLAARELPVEILLVGQEEVVRKELENVQGLWSVEQQSRSTSDPGAYLDIVTVRKLAKKLRTTLPVLRNRGLQSVHVTVTARLDDRRCIIGTIHVIE